MSELVGNTGRSTSVFRLRSGATVTVSAFASEAHWLRILFTANARPFKALAEMGYDFAVKLPTAEGEGRS